MNQQPALYAISGLPAQVVAGIGLACLGLVTIFAVFLLRRRNRGVAAQAHSQHVADLTHLLLRAQYDYPRPTLADLVQCSRHGGLTIRLHLAGSPRELPDPVDLAGMRIIQESLTNALKHGEPNATVVLCYRPDRLTLTVDNPMSGKGAPSRGPHHGLAVMRRRANRLGGSMTAGPYEGGWRVHAELPLRT
ncbi:sensor histidine kinase [Sphaerisporangium corydalis]|uniref:histidine kinase n=1 Tax=Sphaerisporangium corydalis TaxID=1441875 RepID=A0ABV9ERZ5_9ACTN|nr:ATP-binding protein [Sphaerisporangium corydalis]